MLQRDFLFSLQNPTHINSAVAEILGDPRYQTGRYGTFALADAFRYEVWDERANLQPLAQDLTGHVMLKAILDNLDFEALAEDIEEEIVALGVKGFQLERMEDGRMKMPESRDLDYDLATLEGHIAASGFRTSSGSLSHSEAAAFVDYTVNAAIVRHVMPAIVKLQEEGQVLSRENAVELTDHIMIDGGERVNPSYVGEMKRVIETSPYDQPIILATIGCGNGSHDVEIVEALEAQTGRKVYVVGFDPFQDNPKEHAITKELNGVLINKELENGQTYTGEALKALGISEGDAVVLATARYGWHHMAGTFEWFKEKVGSGKPILIEEPMSLGEKSDLATRTAFVGYDGLANWAFEKRFGGNWIEKSIEDPKNFGALYLDRPDEEGDSRTVQGVYPHVITLSV